MVEHRLNCTPLKDARNYVEELMVTIQAHRQDQHAKASQYKYDDDDDEDADVKLHFTNDGVKFFAKIVLPLIQSYFSFDGG